MWKKIQSSVQQPAVDDTSSEVYVYLYRNGEEKTDTTEDGKTNTYYEYECEKIKKDIYEYIVELRNTEDRTADIEAVLAELMFGGEDNE